MPRHKISEAGRDTCPFAENSPFHLRFSLYFWASYLGFLFTRLHTKKISQNMTPSLDQWEKDLFFRVAEEVQESAVNSRTIRVARSVREQESDSHCLLPVMTKRNFKEISVAAASSPMNGYKSRKVRSFRFFCWLIDFSNIRYIVTLNYSGM